MSRILLPTDFSQNSIEAIRYALNIYKNIKATFYLLHTYTPPIYQTEYIIGSPGQIGLGDVFQENSMTQLEKLKDLLEHQYQNPNHTFIVHSAFNTLISEVLETVTAENIDVIIMGTKGVTGANDILFGTHTVHVIRKANCPVIAVPPNFEYEAPLEILFPTDYEIEYKKENMKSLLAIATQHKSRINVMHVRTGYDLTEIQQKNKVVLEKILGKYALSHELPDNGIIEAINEFQIKYKINLLVMVKNKHTFLERLFIEPIIKKIGLHINVPFMVLPQN
ncbi:MULTISPECIES: universal stress protein [Maribacter]|uniref:Nucleotide-binding universal stress protein, UspA family n=2 Tax=Maribacter TaxID=252356 RepID=A0A1I6IHQ7_9FLAO|nr:MULTISPECIES: universal stress protein [Maribacter]SFR66169.1 Nucleotide-binding universal stress protein, UspA family [Maribacter stanieri]SHJ86723.1 Nucleotide-binding universal stress protein, UspA family [Maribacter aquivivus]